VGRPTEAGRSGASSGTGTRGRHQHHLLRIRGEIPTAWRIGLGIGGVAVILFTWWLVAASMDAENALLPTPAATVGALGEMWSDGTLLTDLWASASRILIGYSISVAIGVVVGVAIGSFAASEALFEPTLGFLRYIPATALTPLFLLWLGIGESPKIWLIVVGTVFFNTLMVADVARAVPRELLNASYTLGAGRRTILRRVIMPHSVPGIVDVARINLAAAWLMLVVAELLAAQEGLAYRIVLSQRFRAVDAMFALLIVFGIIGLVSDVFLRWLRNRVAPWDRP
jgi:NitT/TauT family transport system permease protein